MSELRYFYLPCTNAGLNKAVAEVAQHLAAQERPILAQVFQVERKHYEDEPNGWIDRYEVNITPEPDLPENQRRWMTLTISNQVNAEYYRMVADQLVFEVERFWQNESDQKLISQLQPNEVTMLKNLREHGYFDIETPFPHFADQAWKETPTLNPSQLRENRHIIQEDDFSLVRLTSLNLVEIKGDIMKFATAHLTSEGYRILSVMEHHEG